MPHVLLIEAFYGGSHKQLMDLLASAHNATLCTLPSKKWHWRARTAALYFSQTVPRDPEYRVLFTSSVLNLAELVALRPDLAGLKKVLYFHENQLVYPVRKQQDRDFQYGYNQVLSSLVADQILFNSHFNMDSFLSHIPGFLKQMPDFRPKGLPQQIGLKCGVLYFPLAMSEVTAETHNRLNEGNTVKGLGEQSAEMKECVQGNMFIERNSADDVMEHCTETTVQGLDGKCTESTVQGLDGNCTEAAACVQQVSSQMCAHRVNSNQCNQTESSLECNQQLHSEDGSQQVHLQECDNQMYSQACSKTVHCTAEGFVGNGEELSVRKKPRTGVLHIVWPHRWEHDKNPDLFFKTLLQLKSEGLDFRLSVLGESYTDVPEVFSEAQKNLSDEIVHWGFVASKADYYGVLREADVVVSTANHEFYGVAMLEAALCGCFPVCPNKLVYPEIFQHEDCLYNTENQLLKKLRTFCKKPHLVRQKTLGLNVKRFSWDVLQSKFAEVLDV